MAAVGALWTRIVRLMAKWMSRCLFGIEVDANCSLAMRIWTRYSTARELPLDAWPFFGTIVGAFKLATHMLNELLEREMTSWKLFLKSPKWRIWTLFESRGVQVWPNSRHLQWSIAWVEFIFSRMASPCTLHKRFEIAKWTNIFTMPTLPTLSTVSIYDATAFKGQWTCREAGWKKKRLE
jgi:hypothetical protein